MPCKPLQDLLLPKSQVRLDADVRNQAALDVAINRFHIDSEKGFEFFGGEKLGELCSARLPQRI